MSETEKERFNSQFEILQGESVNATSLSSVLTAIENNLINIEVVSNKEFKLELDKNNKNESWVETMKKYIEENKYKKFNIKTEINTQTGLVQYIVVTVLGNN